jgi:prophage antirepressor-like protein
MKLKKLMIIDGNPFADTEFGQLECVEVNGKLYFPASECAKVLGYHNPRKAIIDHCDEPIKLTVPHPQSPLKTIVKNYISEGDLYSLIFNSRLPIGRQFRAWICDEVLPTIRKYGFYVTPKVLAECDGNPEKLKRKLMEIQCYQFWRIGRLARTGFSAHVPERPLRQVWCQVHGSEGGKIQEFHRTIY